MSTRQQRRDWQEFRESHGATPREFKKRWVAMFGRQPTLQEFSAYIEKRDELRKPLGRQKKEAVVHSNIHVQRTISMGHRLPSYDGICASLHGHNVTFEVMVHTTSFLDFKVVDHALGILLSAMDHAMVLHDQDPVIAALRQLPFPQRVVLLNVEPTTEALAQLIFNEMQAALVATGQPEYAVVEVKVYETAKYAASCGQGSSVKRTMDGTI